MQLFILCWILTESPANQVLLENNTYCWPACGYFTKTFGNNRLQQLNDRG
jgi:hypothetical protein